MAEDPDDRWDSYLCRVDDAPASIFLNLRYADKHPKLPTLYAVNVKMLDPGDNGMGTSKEATKFNKLDERFFDLASEAGFVSVGRLRNHGTWQHTFYGNPDRAADFEALARKCFGKRKVSFVSKADRAWAYYRDFLYPSPERRQWMLDRDVVDTLEEHGDRHEVPRRVDHWIYFSTAKSRDAFTRAASKQGFEREANPPRVRGQYGAQVWRNDPVELEHIHDVVMTLFELAKKHGGEYDGWETFIEK